MHALLAEEAAGTQKLSKETELEHVDKIKSTHKTGNI